MAHEAWTAGTRKNQQAVTTTRVLELRPLNAYTPLASNPKKLAILSDPTAAFHAQEARHGDGGSRMVAAGQPQMTCELQNTPKRV